MYSLHIYRFVGYVILVTITSKLDEIVISSLCMVFLKRVAAPPLACVEFLLKVYVVFNLSSVVSISMVFGVRFL